MAFMAKIFRSQIVFFSLLGIVLILIARRIVLLWNNFLPDFSVFYQASSGLLSHIDPYHNGRLFTGLGYPIFTLLFYFPIALLPYQIAQNMFLLLSIICAAISIILSLKILQWFSWRVFFFFFILLLLSFPTSFTLGMGQSNFIAYSLLLFGFYLYKQRNIFSTVVIGLAIIVKPIFAFVLLFFLLKRKIKLSLSVILVVMISIICTIVLFGIGYYHYYFASLVPHLMNLSGREIYYNQGIMGFFARLNQNLLMRKLIPSTLSFLIVVFISWLVLYKKISEELLFSLILTALVLIDTLSWQHHFIFLLFPFLFASHAIKKVSEKKLFSLGLIIAYILISINIKNPLAWNKFPASLALSHVFYGTCLLFILLIYLAFYKKISLKKYLSFCSYLIFLLLVSGQYIIFLYCRTIICLP